MNRFLLSVILSTRRLPPLRALYRWAYRWGLACALRRFRRMPEIRAVFLRRSFARGEWEPGLSDIDLFIEIEELPAGREGKFLARFGEAVAALRRRLPFLGEIEMGTAAEAGRYVSQGDLRGWEAPSEWKEAFRKKGAEPSPLAGSQRHRSDAKMAWDVFTECVHAYGYLLELYFGLNQHPIHAERQAWNARHKILDVARYEAWFRRHDFRVPAPGRSETEARLLEDPSSPYAAALSGLRGCRDWNSYRRALLEGCVRVCAVLGDMSRDLMERTRGAGGPLERAGSASAGALGTPEPPGPGAAILWKECGEHLEGLWLEKDTHAYVVVRDALDAGRLRRVFQAAFHARCHGSDLGPLPLVLDWTAFNAVCISPYLDWTAKQDGLRRCFGKDPQPDFFVWNRSSELSRELLRECLNRIAVARRVFPLSSYARLAQEEAGSLRPAAGDLEKDPA